MRNRAVLCDLRMVHSYLSIPGASLSAGNTTDSAGPGSSKFLGENKALCRQTSNTEEEEKKEKGIRARESRRGGREQRSLKKRRVRVKLIGRKRDFEVEILI